jgi:transcriptional regulator with XRE-family HTH domain
MLPETIENLRYLRELHAKYHGYWRQYFGFSAKQLAEYLGLRQSSFTEIMKGKWGVEKHETRFNEMFKAFQIVEKTLNFRETPIQVWMREQWKKMRNT